MKALHDKVAIVSGASSGIGRASALLFAREGAKVVLGARREAELDELVDEIRALGGESEAVVGDARTEAYAAALVERATDRFGRLDIGFNNAGALLGKGDSTAVALESWHEAIDVNLTSAFLGAKHQIPAMIAGGGGSVIFNSSISGWSIGFPQTAAYGAAKAGLTGLTMALASEFGSRNVRVNALSPGAVDTPAFRAEAPSPEQREFMASLHALKRVATSEEIAQSALYLASDASSFVTGSTLVIDGGIGVTRT